MIAYIAAVYHRERENDSYFYILTALEKQQQQKSKNINGMATKVAKPLFLFWHRMRKFLLKARNEAPRLSIKWQNLGGILSSPGQKACVDTLQFQIYEQQEA